MEMKKDPLNGRVIDILTLGRNAVQVRSYHGHWYSRMFSSIAEAMDWLEGFDILQASMDAQREDDARTRRTRLRGEGWYTDYMTSNDFNLWAQRRDECVKERMNQKPKPKTRKSKPKTEETDAEVSESSVEAG